MEPHDSDARMRAVLERLVGARGASALDDPAKLLEACRQEGLRHDAPAAVALVVEAARRGVPAELARHAASVGPRRAVELAAADLASERNLDPRAAAWVVGRFAEALGLAPAPQPSGAGTAPAASRARTLPTGGPAAPATPVAPASPAAATFGAVASTSLPFSPENVASALPMTAGASPGSGAPPRPPLYRPKPRRRWPWAAGIAAAVLAVAGGAVAGVRTLTSHRAADATTSTTAPATTSTAPPTTPAPSTTTSTTQNPLAPQEAQALTALLSQSANDRAQVSAATSDIATCGNLNADYAALRAAASGRQALLDQLGQLTMSALPNASALSQDLASAWQNSENSDLLYAQWAQDGLNTCTPNNITDPNYVQAEQASAQSTLAKQQFVDVWNPVAYQYGLPTWTQEQL